MRILFALVYLYIRVNEKMNFIFILQILTDLRLFLKYTMTNFEIQVNLFAIKLILTNRYL